MNPSYTSEAWVGYVMQLIILRERRQIEEDKDQALKAILDQLNLILED